MSGTESQQSGTEASLGRQLRAHREARGLTIEDASHHLKIDSALLQDFEEEREPSHNLPEVYCKGFLRNYARFLGVEIQPGQIKACRTSDIRLDEADETYASKRSLLPYLLAAVVVLLVLFFVSGNLNDQPPVVDETMTEKSVPAVEERVVSPPVTTSAEAQQPDTAQSESEADQPEMVKPVTVERGDSASATAPEAEATPSEVPATTPAAEEVVTDAPATVVEESAPIEKRGTVTIRYIDRSFTQVTDGLGRVIVKRMLDAGAVEDFEGPLPLEVNLGNAIGVRVQFNGEPFDHLNYIDDNNIAQFVLGGEE